MKKDMDYIYTSGIFSDETANFVRPFEPKSDESVRILLRCMKNTVSTAYICTPNQRRTMHKIQHSEGDIFDLYEAEFQPSKETIQYFFYVEGERGNLFYTRYGVSKEYQFEGWFQVIKDFITPDWARGAVLYQIYPDRFCNGDETNDVVDDEYEYLGQNVKKVKDWDALPESSDVWSFYGGDLKGVDNKLDYLKDLGVDGIYFNPIFVSPSNHKYDAQDYGHIDPHLGVIVEDTDVKENNEKYKTRVTSQANLTASDELFAKLTAKSHKMGMRVIIDGVFNHCGAYHQWLNAKNIYKSPSLQMSTYKDYFYWNEDGKYDGWWGHDNHPKLNVEGCRELEETLYGVAKKWVSAPFFVDGWRLDVAADLGVTREFNHKFWRKFRDAVKSQKPDALIFAENYGDSTPWLQGDQWDSIMNYDGFMEPVSWFFTGVDKHSENRRDDLLNNASAFWGAMHYEMGKMPIQSRLTAMNQLSNHDHSRFLTRTNGYTGRLHSHGSELAGQDVNVAVFREAILMQMTWIGMPTLYYGDEAGVVGWTDPDNRRTYPWGKEDKDLIEYHKVVIQLRKENMALKFGSLKQLYSSYGVIGYGRFTSENKCIILFNNTDETQKISVPAWEIGTKDGNNMEQLLLTSKNGFSTEKVQYSIESGFIEVILEGKSGILLREEK